MADWTGNSKTVAAPTLVATLLLTATLLAGCGSDDKAPPRASTSTPTSVATATHTLTAVPTQTPTATSPPTATHTSSPSPSITPTSTATPQLLLAIVNPVPNQLSLTGPLSVLVQVTGATPANPVVVKLDGVDVTTQLVVSDKELSGTLEDVPAGTHTLRAEVGPPGRTVVREVVFEAITLSNPDQCEILNDVECLLPYPSSRFLEPADTPTGFRLALPEIGMPQQGGRALPSAPYAELDGFSPTVQILMHFPGGVDPEKSNASRLLPATRTYDGRSLESDSPTVLLDVTSDPPQRVLHFVENDVRAASPDRQVLFLRPGRSLTPGHRYIVAARNLKHADNTPVIAEPVFAALRDSRPTDIAAVTARKDELAGIFAALTAAGVPKEDLVLAFEFVVQSDAGLTGQMLSMRDQGFTRLAQEPAASTFSIDDVAESDCSAPGATVWRLITGSYTVPLFLKRDPVTDPHTPAVLNVDDQGTPVQNGFTHPPFTISLPCTALANGGTPKLAVVLGHGLFGDGRGFVESVAGAGIDAIAGATDWRGLSSPDISGADLPATFIGRVILSLRNFPALPDRLRQGQLNTLMLAKMMKMGVFNVDPAFQTPEGVGVFAGPAAEEFYLGGSLGGIMGLMFSALSPDVTNSAVVVPAINFSLLLQRATPFTTFEDALELTGIGDSMEQALLLSILHELWVRGESAGYATHITSDPLPGTNAKNILMASAFVDQQVSNQGTEIAARTLGLPSLIGSLQTNLAEIPDRDGPLPSALVMYDTGSFDLTNPADAPFIAPLANEQPESNRCDPHGLQSRIPAALDQLRTFLQPGGQVVNYCNGRCDAGEPNELPDGRDTPCDPLAR